MAANTVLLAIQALTFVGLGALFFTQAQWRLGTAQLLLAVVTVVLYSGSMK